MLDIDQPNVLGGMWLGLAATVTGSDAAHDVVGDFTGSTQTIFDTGSIPAPIVATHSGVNGSEFKISEEGVWHIHALVQAQTAASVRAAVGLDNVLGDLSIDPVLTSRTPDMGLSISAGLDTVPIKLASGPMIVTRNMAKDPTLGIVRLLLSNNAGAGAADAAVAVALCYIRITRSGPIPRAVH